jgi:peptidoglycan-associated lipoprotein
MRGDVDKERKLNRQILVLLVSALVIAGCKSKPPKVDAPVATNTPTTSTQGPTTTGIPPSTGSQNSGSVATVNIAPQTTGGALGPAGALRIIYFDYDSSDVRNEFIDVIATHGRFLAGNATVRVRLEGHSDERGSREYNIALGERRAQTVKKALALQGVQESQIATVSYGEERPAAAGSDDNAWSKNRRVEIVYIN